MAAISLYDSLKKQKSNEDDDKISNLPNVIILHIFSFIPMKDAVRTSVLSKRWEYVWTSIANLNFDIPYGQEKQSLVNFVDRALTLRDCCTMKRFSLSSSVELGSICIRRWITAAIWRNVEDLDIQFWSAIKPMEMPYCLFTCPSLTKLSLSLSTTLKIPSSISLSSLKHLVLKYVTFLDDKSTENFLYGCPKLETMGLLECNWENVSRISICAPKLWKLEISEGENGTSSSEKENGCNVLIFAPSLKCFLYEGEFLNNYTLYEVPYLEEGKIQMEYDVSPYVYPFDDEWVRLVFPRLYKLLKGLSNVKKLALSRGVVEVLNERKLLLPYIPLFKSLSALSFYHLTIELDTKALMKILQNSPCLETLRFEGGVTLSEGILDCMKEGIFEPVPFCFLSRLKIIEILFNGSENNQDLIVEAMAILLKSAAVLEKLTIVRYFGDYEALVEELKEFPRASSSCQIDFVEEADLATPLQMPNEVPFL